VWETREQGGSGARKARNEGRVRRFRNSVTTKQRRELVQGHRKGSVEGESPDWSSTTRASCVRALLSYRAVSCESGVCWKKSTGASVPMKSARRWSGKPLGGRGARG